jgi:TRAP-type C4-dicarboxylate transport system substrate-binding protein
MEKATNGRVTVELYPSQTLMKSTDALDAVKTGIADMGMIIPAYFPGKFPVLDILQLPFGASTSTGASAIAWDLYAKTPEFQKSFADYKVISLWTTEPMYFHGTKKNYKTLDDFKGQQIRASAGAATDMVTNLGGSAVFFGMGDSYVNLQKGVVDAIVTPSEGAMGFRTYEVAPYLTRFPGVPAIHMIVMSKKIWDEMPADVQKAIDGVTQGAMSKKAGSVNDMARTDMAAKCKEGGYTLTEYNVPDAELAKWIEKAGNPMRQAWIKNVTDKGVTNAQAIMDDYIKLTQQYK